MKINALALPSVILCLGLCSCAATMPQIARVDPLQGINTYKATRDDAWSACVRVLAERGAPIQVVEKESGLITTQMVQFTDGMDSATQIKRVANLPAGGGFLSIWAAGRYSMNIYVVAITDSTTQVRVTPHIEAFERNLSKQWFVCESNGALEGKFFEQVGAVLHR